MFDINMIDESWGTDSKPLNIDVDDLRRRVACPAMSVQQLSLKIKYSNELWDFSTFFEEFFTICHPGYVKVSRDKPFEDKNNIYKYLVKGLMENEITKRYYWSNLKHVEIINPDSQSNSVEFKLDW